MIILCFIRYCYLFICLFICYLFITWSLIICLLTVSLSSNHRTIEAIRTEANRTIEPNHRTKGGRRASRRPPSRIFRTKLPQYCFTESDLSNRSHRTELHMSNLSLKKVGFFDRAASVLPYEVWFFELKPQKTSDILNQQSNTFGLLWTSCISIALQSLICLIHVFCSLCFDHMYFDHFCMIHYLWSLFLIIILIIICLILICWSLFITWSLIIWSLFLIIIIESSNFWIDSNRSEPNHFCLIIIFESLGGWRAFASIPIFESFLFEPLFFLIIFESLFRTLPPIRSYRSFLLDHYFRTIIFDH